MDILPIKIVGYDKINTNKNEGIRFAWRKESCPNLIESAAFINRRKNVEDNICGYTSSVSSGCVLRAIKSQCTFCRTGNLIPFGGMLSYKEIAKQNVFMVLADMYCKDNKDLANKQREFAYMGQGEPGYSYAQVRLAIELTNKIMKDLKQSVYRHVFATAGVTEAIYAYKNDLKYFFTEKVTLHLSLHSTINRNTLMPINKIYPYQEVLSSLDEIYDISNEKPCIGIMLFHDFKPNAQQITYTSSYELIKKTLLELNPAKCRLSFCEYNESNEIGSSTVYPTHNAKKIIDLANELGFEAKLFSSFGKKEQAACGMLGGKPPENAISDHWRELDSMADRLIKNNI